MIRTISGSGDHDLAVDHVERLRALATVLEHDVPAAPGHVHDECRARVTRWRLEAFAIERDVEAWSAARGQP